MENKQNIEPVLSNSVFTEQNDFVRRVYGWMGLGLLVTSIIAYIVASSPLLINMILGNMLVFYALLILELLTVVYLSRAVQKMSSAQAGIVFLLYAALNGLTISVIFLVYQIASIGSVFIATSGMFALISAYGYFTKRDLTSVGHIAFMALIGIIIASVFNLFFWSDMTALIISYITVIIFTGLTAYDTQKIKNLNTVSNIGTEMEKKESIVGALTLYLDFINLFLNLLRIMGRRK